MSDIKCPTNCFGVETNLESEINSVKLGCGLNFVAVAQYNNDSYSIMKIKTIAF